MDARFVGLKEWQDNPYICSALNEILDGKDPVVSLVDMTVRLAENLRDAEDYMLIHKLQCPAESDNE